MVRIDAFQEAMQKSNGSDLHLCDGMEPLLGVDGVLKRTQHKPLSSDDAFRGIPYKIPTVDGVGFPSTLTRMLESRGGLILATGPANSGKATTLAVEAPRALLSGTPATGLRPAPVKQGV